MRIVSVEKKGNNVLVEFDDKEKITIPFDVYLNNSLYLNCELSSVQLERIKIDSEKYLIKENSFRYLSNRNHSKLELAQKLRKKKYRKELIDEIILELTEKDYLNDERFANEYFNAKLKRNIGPRKIKAGLYQKGVDREVIELVEVNNFDDQILFENATKVALKKYNQLKVRQIDQIKIKQKLYSFLISKGYSSDIINKVLQNLINTYE